MAWTNIPNANLQVGAPLRSVDILALRDNVSAVPTGNAGAPRVQAEALNGNQSGNAPIYAARAWVSFDGTGTFSPNPSTTKIRSSGNVSSITKNNTGDYVINFATAMQDTNYAVVLGGRPIGNDFRAYPSIANSSTYSTTQVNVLFISQTALAATDPDIFNLVVMR